MKKISLERLSNLPLIRKLLIYLGQANARSNKQVMGLSYEEWQHQFLLARLNLASWLFLIGYFFLSLLNFSRMIFKNEPFFDQQLWGQILVQLCLIGCLFLMKTPWGNRHANILFIAFSLSIGMARQILSTTISFGQAELFSLSILFLVQATLIPVRSHLHFISQISFLIYYFWAGGGFNTGFSSKSQLINWMLGLVWVCCICNLSVYLYERLQRTEFNTRSQLEAAYQELEIAETKYRSIFENSIDGIFQAGIDGRYHTVNPAMAKIYGYKTPEELIINLAANSQKMYVDTERYNEFHYLLQKQQEIFNFEAEIYRADGRKIWISTNARCLCDSQGKIVLYEGNVKNITERKRAEVEMNKALQKEKELNQLKSRFISMTSHEFRTPLTTILASAEALEHYGKKWSDEKNLSYLKRIQLSVNQMVALLNDVLILGKAEADKWGFNPSSIELIAFCQNLVEEMQLSIGSQHQITFINHQNGELKSDKMDEKLLRHILTNLISNGIKYSPPGSEIQLELSSKNEQIIFEIKDHGMGIPLEDQKHLFTSFHRAKNVGNIQGTGLGLAIVKKAVEAHQGEITLSSIEGQGTTFTITLPC